MQKQTPQNKNMNVLRKQQQWNVSPISNNTNNNTQVKKNVTRKSSTNKNLINHLHG